MHPSSPLQRGVGNRDLYALPWRPSGCSVGDLSTQRPAVSRHRWNPLPLLLSHHPSAHLRRPAPLPGHTVSPALTTLGWWRNQQQGLHPDRARLRSHCLQPLRWNGFEKQPSALSMHTSALAGIRWFGAGPPGFCCFCKASSPRKREAF